MSDCYRWLSVWMCMLALCAPSAVRAQTALFTAPEGASIAGLAVADGGAVYITLSDGGAFNRGSIVRRDADGGVTVLHSFRGPEGTRPLAAPTIGADGELYGTTSSGGANGYGTLFKLTRAGDLTILHQFTLSQGGPSRAPLLQAADGGWRGLTWGVYRYDEREERTDISPVSPGAVFELSPTGDFRTLYHGLLMPSSGLTQVDNGDLYGVTPLVPGETSESPAFSLGDVYRVTPRGVAYFGVAGPSQPFNPSGELVADSAGFLYGASRTAFEPGHVFRLTPAPAGGVVLYTRLTDQAVSGLALGGDGQLYGGGTHGYVRVTTEGVITPLAPYTPEIRRPTSALRADADGGFFIGSHDSLLRLTQAGAANAVRHFGYAQGDELEQVIVTRDGSTYGTTRRAGRYGFGALFHVAKDGRLHTLEAFQAGHVSSLATALVEGEDGAAYAVTNDDRPRLIRMSGGELTTLHTFDDFPRRTRWYDHHEALQQGDDGAWYGTKPVAGWTPTDAPYTATDIYRFDPATGTLTVLSNVTGEIGPLLRAASGRLFGVRIPWEAPETYELFRVSLTGELTILHRFASGPDGHVPTSNLVQLGNSIYGFARGNGTRHNIIYRWTIDDELEVFYTFAQAVSATRLAFGPDAELYLSSPPAGIWPTARADSYVLAASGELQKLQEPNLGVIATADGAILRIAPLSQDGYSGFELSPVAPPSAANLIR